MFGAGSNACGFFEAVILPNQLPKFNVRAMRTSISMEASVSRFVRQKKSPSQLVDYIERTISLVNLFTKKHSTKNNILHVDSRFIMFVAQNVEN